MARHTLSCREVARIDLDQSTVSFSATASIVNQSKFSSEWSAIGGICGRGVLLDYEAFVQARGIKDYCPGNTHPISVKTLEEVAAWEGVQFQPGDILLLRTGWTEWHDSLDEASQVALTKEKHDNAGLLAEEETAEWIW